MKVIHAAIAVLFFGQISLGQNTLRFADSIRISSDIPELAYAVVSSSGVLELQTLGVKKINTSLTADSTDKFRIGSNTKAITGFIAAQLVKAKKISWNTKFFDLFPELKRKSKKAYHELTLLDLLSFRTRLFAYTYTYDKPTADQFSGTEEQQRYQFTEWFFQQKPLRETGIHFSNLGYAAAGLMLEKASGKSYKQLVKDLGEQLDITFGFGAPNSTDSLQTWGHDASLVPEPPGDNFKLNWLLPAGNINVSLPDYTKFIQLQLLGLRGQSDLLSKEEFEFIHYGLEGFSIGWAFGADENENIYSYNKGNPGTFLSAVYVFKNNDLAIIILTNAQTTRADPGIDALFEELKKNYLKQ